MPWSGQPPEHKQTKFLLYRSCRTRRRPTVRHWDDKGWGLQCTTCGWTVFAETSADTCTCICTCTCIGACTCTCARMWTRTCSCFFELYHFIFCRWGPLVFACVFSCSFPIFSFYLSFYSQTVHENCRNPFVHILENCCDFSPRLNTPKINCVSIHLFHQM